MATPEIGMRTFWSEQEKCIKIPVFQKTRDIHTNFLSFLKKKSCCNSF